MFTLVGEEEGAKVDRIHRGSAPRPNRVPLSIVHVRPTTIIFSTKISECGRPDRKLSEPNKIRVSYRAAKVP